MPELSGLVDPLPRDLAEDKIMAFKQPIEHMTLRDKVREAARVARELEEHLSQAFGPKVQQASEATRVRRAEDMKGISDNSVRSLVHQVIECEVFSAKLEESLNAIVSSILAECESSNQVG